MANDKATNDCPKCKERLLKLGVLLEVTIMLGCPKCRRVYWQSPEERYGKR